MTEEELRSWERKLDRRDQRVTEREQEVSQAPPKRDFAREGELKRREASVEQRLAVVVEQESALEDRFRERAETEPG